MQITSPLRLAIALATTAAVFAVTPSPVLAQATGQANSDVGKASPGDAPAGKKKKKRAATAKSAEKTTETSSAAKATPPEKPPETPKPNAKGVLGPRTPAPSPPELLPQLADSTPPSKIAISSFVIEGDNPPAALVYQLQDGFVLGLVRAGVRVIDHDDLKNRLKDQPDLLGCDASPCLKQLGQELGVRYVVRVQVAITGNSYRMSARVFRTTGAAPAALPVETLSRFCDVCTVTEAREAMLRLADGVRVPDEPMLAAAEAPKPVAVPYRPSRRFAMSSVAIGVTSVIVGTVVLAASGDRDKGLHALGGAFMGAGMFTSIGGLYLYGESVRPLPAPPPAPLPARPTAE